jgi:hypothetical protein
MQPDSSTLLSFQGIGASYLKISSGVAQESPPPALNENEEEFNPLHNSSKVISSPPFHSITSTFSMKNTLAADKRGRHRAKPDVRKKLTEDERSSALKAKNALSLDDLRTKVGYYLF